VKRRMIYSKMVKTAMNIAYRAHEGQYDKSGVPYIFHPYEVAQGMTTEDEITTALLHDVVEDTNITFEDLIGAGISEPVIESLKLLTHNDETPYLDYVKKLKSNTIARKVKLADLKHNSNITRIEEPNEWDYKRIDKYKEAIKILE
jgi:(p)ppGpp synthase/HD superfamily hydrolase